MFYEIVGWIGATLVLFAYLLVSTRKILPTSKKYQLMNLFGSLGIIVNALFHMAIPIVSLNIIWLLIALYGLISATKKR